MTKKPLLSICIPTYNRAEFLKSALDSILMQIDKNKDKIEICISDNASEDNTEELVKEYMKKSPISIIYHKNKNNMGADYNFLKVIEIANGKYCWLLGSDDIIEKGGIDIVLKEIEKNEIDILTFWRKVYTRNLKKEIKEVEIPKILKINKEKIILKNPIETLYYTSNLWTYISIIVIKKNKWLSIKNYNKIIGSNYIHVYIIYNLIKNGIKIKFLNKKLVGWRSGKDSFSDNLGDIKRFAIDLNILELSKSLFGENSKELNIIKKNFLKKGYIIMAKIRNKNYNYFIKMFKSLLPYYYKKVYFWTTFVPLFFIPNILALQIYKFYKKGSR